MLYAPIFKSDQTKHLHSGNEVVTPEPISFLELSIFADKSFEHHLPAGWNGYLRR